MARSQDGSTTKVVSLAPISVLWIAGGILAAFFLLELSRNITDTLTRVTLGITFAFALDPVVSVIKQRLNISRGKAVFLVGIGTLLAFGLLATLVGPRAVAEARNLPAELPQTIDKLTTVPGIGPVLERADVPDRLRSYASELPARLDDQAVGELIETLIGGLVAGLTVTVVIVATLADGETLVRRLRQLVPAAQRERADVVGRIFRRTIGAYFAGSLLVSSLAATFVLSVGLALGVPLAPLAAVWVLVVSLIPQIGGFLSGSVFTILGFAKSPGTGVACLVLYVVYMNIENHVIQPAVVGKAVDLSAPATMLAALVGAASAGVPGAIIATPLVGTAKALFFELRHPDAAEAESEPPPNGTSWRRKALNFGRKMLRRSPADAPV